MGYKGDNQVRCTKPEPPFQKAAVLPTQLCVCAHWFFLKSQLQLQLLKEKQKITIFSNSACRGLYNENHVPI